LEDEDILKFFSDIAEKADQDSESIKKVFKILFKTTLQYRDMILKAKGVTVTVQDVKTALDWLLPALKTGKLPATDDKVRLDLLKLWMDELRIFING
jgi:hypothetical protein